ncbi:phage tail protein [Pseudomonas asiatica]|uniref:phage tail protein n=2 Tax=Pseudomonas asiatica TaxID=2219225 RepID=UPI00209A995D|nr:phage tail protein [Pseudomonas asiatica]MCO7537803.1 phage tail protein [Pseudomonas asiatica]MCO7551703.1 phage tail protein [Pseudomonas asiatica]
MDKPNSLREHLLAAVPGLKPNPDRLLMFVDAGKVRCTAAASLSFEYTYTLQIILTDFPGHPDSVMLPILAWTRTHQTELMANLEKSAEGIKFEVDILDSSKVDMSITLALTERVVVKRQDAGNFQVVHVPDQPYDAYDEPGSISLYAGGELLAQWQPPAAPDAMALAVTHPRRPAHG